MIIKSSKRVKIIYAFTGLFCAFASFMISGFGHNLILFLATLIVLELCVLRAILTHIKTIIIDERGCTVKLLCFRQKYRWDELKTKRIMVYGDRLCARGDVYEKGVIFSPREKIYIPKIISFLLYMEICINPFSFFVVNFKTSARNDYPVYEVDEEEFMSKMAEYGVTLQK